MKYLRRLLLSVIMVLAMAGTALAAVPDNIDPLTLPEWSVTATSYGGKLLLSDSPEMVPGDGILYQDEVTGDARLFLYHVNATTSAKKIVVLLENKTAAMAQVTILQDGVGGPSADWLGVGKAAQTAYLAGRGLAYREVPAHGAALLSSALDSVTVGPNMLINGIFDFRTDRPVTVKVMMLPVNDDPGKFVRQARVLPPDAQRLRGTFDGKDRMLIPRKVYNPAQDGPVTMTLADNALDRYLEGIDATTGDKVINYGNYGVMYRLFLPSDGPGQIEYYLNPRGGVYAGAMGVRYQHANEPPVLTPAGQTAFGADGVVDFAAIGRFAGGQSLWLTFSPPGASNLPVKLIILPR